MTVPNGYPRQAWLELGGVQLYLDDFDTGYACMELDIGFPEVRDVVNNNPDRNGVNDRTTLLGARVVTATIQAFPGGSSTIDDIARLFGPYTNPAVRPELHWTLNTADHAERMLTLRAADFAAPMPAPLGREIMLGWVAADPVCYDPTVQQAVGWPTGTIAGGRTYNLTFNRVYPQTIITGQNAYITVTGDVPAYPDFRIYGPITGPVLQLTQQLTATQTSQTVINFALDSTVVVPTGGWIDINAATRTVTDQNGNNLQAHVIWSTSSWPALAPNSTWTLALGGTSTGTVTQVLATWQDGYLTP